MRNRLHQLLRGAGLLLLLCTCQPIWASDGFDNNFVGSNTNQLTISVNNAPHVALFGPGDMSSPGYYIPVPNNTTYDFGQVTQFSLSKIETYMRSAYLDRVLNDTFFYRIYLTSSPPPAWTKIALTDATPLQPGNCYGFTQPDRWEKNITVDVLSGLGNGAYTMEFYAKADLTDVGAEPNPCGVIDIAGLCDPSFINPGRYLSSRFNEVDPTACNYLAVQAAQSNPTKVFFQITGALPLSWIRLEASTHPTDITLHWQTSDETNLYAFQVEHSANGWQWQTSGTVPAGDNAYQWTDYSPTSGTNYYRLKVLENDGKYAFSKVIIVPFTYELTHLQVFPVPANDRLFWKTETEETAYYTIFNTQGAVCMNGVVEHDWLDIAALLPGVYYLQLADEERNKPVVAVFVKQ